VRFLVRGAAKCPLTGLVPEANSAVTADSGLDASIVARGELHGPWFARAPAREAPLKALLGHRGKRTHVRSAGESLTCGLPGGPRLRNESTTKLAA
jgi:hypothetical protein